MFDISEDDSSGVFKIKIYKNMGFFSFLRYLDENWYLGFNMKNSKTLQFEEAIVSVKK